MEVKARIVEGTGTGLNYTEHEIRTKLQYLKLNKYYNAGKRKYTEKLLEIFWIFWKSGGETVNITDS